MTIDTEANNQTLILPRILGANNISELLNICADIRSSDNIIIDASNYVYGSPIGITMLKAAIHNNHPCRVRDVLWMDRSRASYLERMNFFSNVSAPSVALMDQHRNDRTDRLVELKKLLDEGEVEDVATQISTALTQSFIREARANQVENFNESAICDPISYMVAELLLNATTHAKRHGHYRSKAWISAQAIDATNHRPAQIEIAIVDDGCGMLRTLADQLTDNTSNAEAIEMAMRPLVSCNFGVDFAGNETSNQGVGLYVAKDMILQAGGRLQIISNNCLYDSDAIQRRTAFKDLDSEWGGVAISLTIPFGKIYGITPLSSLDKITPPKQSGIELNFS